MYYSISGLCPQQMMGGYGFSVRLFPEWKEMVANNERLSQSTVNNIIATEGHQWLDSCGFNDIYDPDNSGVFADPKRKPGPDARQLFEPNEALRVAWGEWGPEHIEVPGNACGLDIDDHAWGKPPGGMVLVPHNVDSWPQVQLLLITFCFFAEHMSVNEVCRKLEAKRRQMNR